MITLSFIMLWCIQNIYRAKAKDWDNYYINPPAGMVILTGLIDTIILVTMFFVCYFG